MEQADGWGYESHEEGGARGGCVGALRGRRVGKAARGGTAAQAVVPRRREQPGARSGVNFGGLMAIRFAAAAWGGGNFGVQISDFTSHISNLRGIEICAKTQAWMKGDHGTCEFRAA